MQTNYITIPDFPLFEICKLTGTIRRKAHTRVSEHEYFDNNGDLVCKFQTKRKIKAHVINPYKGTVTLTLNSKQHSRSVRQLFKKYVEGNDIVHKTKQHRKKKPLKF